VEVIWDMLLSEFIPDILAYAVPKMKGQKISESTFYLLAKEFPIKVSEDIDYLRSAKADYLVADDSEKKIIIVELKTTNSENKEQLNRYLNCTVKDLFSEKHYEKLITSKVKNSLYGKDPLKWKHSEKYASQITYMYNQIRDTKFKADVVEAVGGKVYDNYEQFHREFIRRLRARYSSVDVYYLYVAREKAVKGNDSCKFSVRLQKREKEETDEKRKQNTITIYSPEDEKGSEDDKDKFEKKLEGSKLEAWKHLEIMIDAVYNYSKDFDEKKKYIK
jgi:hypothetical protein